MPEALGTAAAGTPGCATSYFDHKLCKTPGFLSFDPSSLSSYGIRLPHAHPHTPIPCAPFGDTQPGGHRGLGAPLLHPSTAPGSGTAGPDATSPCAGGFRGAGEAPRGSLCPAVPIVPPPHGCPLSPKRALSPFSSVHPSSPCPECSPLPMGAPHCWPRYHTTQRGAADRAPPWAALHPAMTRGQHGAGQGCSWRKRQHQGVLRAHLLRGPPPRAQRGQWERGGAEGPGLQAEGRGDAGCRRTAGPGGSSLVVLLLGRVLADEGVPLAAGVVLPRHETCERREQSERWGGQRGCAGRALLRVGGFRSSLGTAVPRAGVVPLSPPHGTSSVPAHPRSPPAPCSISPWGARRRPRRSSASWSRLSTPGLGSGPREEGGWR